VARLLLGGNIAGAVLGALAAVLFAATPRHGISSHVAVAINLSVGVAAIAISRLTKYVPAKSSPSATQVSQAPSQYW